MAVSFWPEPDSTSRIEEAIVEAEGIPGKVGGFTQGREKGRKK